jgi:hypothetical protein
VGQIRKRGDGSGRFTTEQSIQSDEPPADHPGRGAKAVLRRAHYGGAIFSLLHSLFGGIVLFVVGVIIARIATKHDVEILRVLFNSGKFRRRYDPMKENDTEIRMTRRDA